MIKASCLPPGVVGFFDNKLLSVKLTTELERMQQLLDKVEKKFPRKLTEKEWEIIHKIEENIERSKEKEKNPKAKIRNKTEEPFYHLKCSSKREQRILEGFRYGISFGYTSTRFGYDKIPPFQKN